MEDTVPTNLAIFVKTKQLEITRAGLKQGPSTRKEVAHLKNIKNRTEPLVPEILFSIPQILFNSF